MSIALILPLKTKLFRFKFLKLINKNRIKNTWNYFFVSPILDKKLLKRLRRIETSVYRNYQMIVLAAILNFKGPRGPGHFLKL